MIILGCYSDLGVKVRFLLSMKRITERKLMTIDNNRESAVLLEVENCVVLMIRLDFRFQNSNYRSGT